MLIARLPGNRLLQLIKNSGLSVDQVAERVNTHRTKIYKLASGEQRMTREWLERLAPVLGVAPTDILDLADLSVAIEHTVASAFAEDHAPFDLEAPFERVTPPRRLKDPDHCVAVDIGDTSCDGLWPKGAVLVVRKLAKLDRPLRVADKIVVRRYRTDRTGGVTMEILAGLLERSIAGDLSLLLRTSNRELPQNVTIRAATTRGAALPPSGPAEIAYEPMGTDRGEIIGRIVLAITPED